MGVTAVGAEGCRSIEGLEKTREERTMRCELKDDGNSMWVRARRVNKGIDTVGSGPGYARSCNSKLVSSITRLILRRQSWL